MTASHSHSSDTPRAFDVRILRQDSPDSASYWERHRVPYEHDMNVISVLQRIAAQARGVDGEQVSPVAWECCCLEEVCGSCTMLVNGKVRQACTALVDRLLADEPDGIELRPMSKFPIVRDLVVQRQRMFRALKKVRAWIDVDGYYDAGPGPRQSPEEQEAAYPLSQCMTCGCCLEACPQYTKVEVVQEPGESDAEFELRRDKKYDSSFLGAQAISQAILFNSHPTGSYGAAKRLDALIDEGGIQICGNTQNCVAVCPKEIPLTTSIAKAGRHTTWHQLKKWFDQ